MDDTIQQCCPNCSQNYTLKLNSSSKHSLPLFLECGHSMCENCVQNIVKFAEPIECKICHHDMTLPASDVALLGLEKQKLYELFPVNHQMVGELTVQNLQNAKSKTSNDDKEFFIDVAAILKADNKDFCVECQNPTDKMCEQCANILCLTCFTKSHKNFVIFKNHILKDIGEIVTQAVCKNHNSKPLNYYCKDCKKCNCMDCLLMGGETSCKNHNVVSTDEVNDYFVEQLTEIAPKVDETFRRLTKTAYDVGHLLYNIENETSSASEFNKMLSEIEQHFSKLCFLVQKSKREVVSVVTKLKTTEKESIDKIKMNLSDSLKKTKAVMDSIRMLSDVKKIKEMNPAALYEEATQIAESAWYLTREEADKTPLKLSVKDDVCASINDYIHVEGNVNPAYKLCKTSEIEEGVKIPDPPPAPVFAPVLPKDVRQNKNTNKHQNQPKEVKSKEDVLHPPCFLKNAPTFAHRSKSGSVSSLNSCSSGSSQKSDAQPSVSYNAKVQAVQPFQEHQIDKTLVEGSQELAYVCHIVNPHEFYVQRASHKGLVKNMLRCFRNGASLPQPSVNHVVEGKIYLAFNKVDKMWQRCRVLSVDKKNEKRPLCRVFCFDFGSTEVVEIDKLRLIHPNKALTPPPLAIHCSLANCGPQLGQWTKEDSILMHEIIDNKQVVISVRQVNQMDDGSVQLICDVTTYEDGVSIAHALVFHERAKIYNSRLACTQHVGTREKAKIAIVPDYKYKSEHEVCICYTVSPDKFYVRKSYQQKLYEQLTLDLEREYSIADNTDIIYLPELDLACCVNVPERSRNDDTSGLEDGSFVGAGAWARAVITGLIGRGRVTVLLVDCGAVLNVHWRALRYLHPKFTKLCALATECHLAGIVPVQKIWRTGSLSLMKKFSDHYIQMRVEDNKRNSIGVTLIDNSDHENPVCVNQEMVRHKFAITFGIYCFNKFDDTTNQVVTNKSPLAKPVRHPKPKPEVHILKRNEPQTIKSSDLEAKDKGPLRIEAKILQYQSPSLIYVALAHQQKAFKEFFEKIQNHYSQNKPTTKAKWEVGDKCCAVCLQSQTWRRAVIIELTDENAKVFYSDFATVETLPIKSLVELTPEFAAMGDAAIKCHLCGVIPAVGEEWPSLTKEYLKDLLDCYKRIFITKLGNYKNKSMPIEIWVYHTIPGGALEANKSEWRCLNKKIIEQGLGVPDKSETSQVQESSETKTDDGDEIISFMNVKGSIQDWLQLEPIPIKPLPMLDDESKSQEGIDDSQDSELSNVMFISDWLPPEPLQAKEFTAMPTYIDNDGVIYLHDINQQGTLDLIRKAYDVRFKAPDPKAKYQKWEVGEPCVALYYLDNRFYRGRVMEVNKQTATCTVRYIDYGNEEQCSFINMRKSIDLHQIPTQAHRCILSRIRPPGLNWERQVLDYMHGLVVEKHCNVKVVRDAVDDITLIELYVDKICINDHLVEFEMAEYIDGTKAVLRKFAPASQIQSKASSVQGDPDYIVDDAHDSFDVNSMKGKDWNEILDEEEGDLGEISFEKFCSDMDDEFLCNITLVQDPHVLDLDIVHGDDEAALYAELFKELQDDGDSRPPINGIFENKACIALFQQDMQWYRACVLEYSESVGKVKVRYVDYGNIDVVDVTDVREIHPEWAKLPPSSVPVMLHGVKLNPELEVDAITRAYGECFLDKGPFTAKVIKQDKYPIVELRNKDGQLVYHNLIEQGVFLVSEEE